MNKTATMLTIGNADFIGTADDVYKAYQALLVLQRVGLAYNWEGEGDGERHFYFNDNSALEMKSMAGMPAFGNNITIFPNRQEAEEAIEIIKNQSISSDDSEEDAA